MNLTDSDRELYGQLVDAEYAMPAPQRMTARWVMSKEWADRIGAMKLSGQMPMMWVYLPDKVLFGKPVKIADDGVEPHLEAEPQRGGVLVEPGQEVVYIKCDDPACPKHTPGLHPAHLERP